MSERSSLLRVGDQKLTLTSEGYLCDLTRWDRSVGQALAAQDDLRLEAPHWEILFYLREFYAEFQHTPPMRALVNALKERFGADKGNSAYLHHLFPKGPAKQASRLAGLPKPSRCT